MLRRGFSNATLFGAIGLLALVTLLLQVQSGAINPLAMFAKKPAAAAQKSKTGTAKKVKQPPMITFPADPLQAAAGRYVAQRQADAAAADTIKHNVWRAVGHMDPAAAAAVLAAMDQTAAVQVLSRLRMRELALVLAEAPPALAAQWAAALLNQPALPEVPEPFRKQAQEAGLYDDTAELLQQYAEQQSGTATGAGTEPAEGAAGEPPPPQAGAAASPPAAGAAAVQPGSGSAPPQPPSAPDTLPTAYHGPAITGLSLPSNQQHEKKHTAPAVRGGRGGEGAPAHKHRQRPRQRGELEV